MNCSVQHFIVVDYDLLTLYLVTAQHLLVVYHSFQNFNTLASNTIKTWITKDDYELKYFFFMEK